MGIESVAVERPRERQRFVALARRFRGASPQYVPPLASEVARLLDPQRNPALLRARQALWIARDERGEPRGRVGALYDPRHAESLGERAGWFGFFDAADAATARDLLDRAWDWARSQGAETMLGPADPDTNHECGCLVEGRDELPYMMMPHHPPEYAAWIEAAGLRRAKDLLAFETTIETFPEERLRPVVARIVSRGGFALHAVTKHNVPRMLELAREVYNEAWRGNWGFLPLSREEFHFEARGFRPLLERDFCWVATRGGAPAGFILSVRDVNPVIQAIGGRLLPFGILRFPFLYRKVSRMRVLALGIVPEFRNRGLETALIHASASAAMRRGITACEMSWVLEDNSAMTRLADALGGRVSRRYRIYRRSAP